MDNYEEIEEKIFIKTGWDCNYRSNAEMILATRSKFKELHDSYVERLIAFRHFMDKESIKRAQKTIKNLKENYNYRTINVGGAYVVNNKKENHEA